MIGAHKPPVYRLAAYNVDSLGGIAEKINGISQPSIAEVIIQIYLTQTIKHRNKIKKLLSYLILTEY